ncbi:MAG: DUF6338 family protein [Actinomycetota bacterium]|nr:DUF6338 family protein [Actinomycetota bacterium]
MIPTPGWACSSRCYSWCPARCTSSSAPSCAGPRPDDASATNRLLRALAVSAFLATVYAATAGPHLVTLLRDSRAQPTLYHQLLAHGREFALWALVLLFLIPAGLAALNFLRLRRGWTLRLTYDPTPRAWDYAFRDIDPTYVRVLTTEGVWLGGWYGPNSFASSYPEPREIYIETAHVMAEDGSFGAEQPGSGGL